MIGAHFHGGPLNGMSRDIPDDTPYRVLAEDHFEQGHLADSYRHREGSYDRAAGNCFSWAGWSGPRLVNREPPLAQVPRPALTREPPETSPS